MKKRKVWKLIKKSKVPKGRKLLGNKWVFKEKKNGVFRARLVALGYNQIPGVDYTENYAPVVDAVTVILAIIWAIMLQLDGEIIDVETAFLYGMLEELLFMTIPEGLEYFKQIEDDMCAQLLATLYGLVQAARQFWKKLMATLEQKMGFICSCADHCLLVKFDSQRGPILFVSYVDDAAIFGTPEGRAWFKNEIRKYFSIKESNPLTEYVGVKIYCTKDGFVLH